MNRRALVTAVVIAAFLTTSLLVRPATAADVPTTLVAYNVNWHVGTHTTPPQPTITVNAGDVLRLRIENHDNFPHTFTFPHFTVNRTLDPGTPTTPFVAFVNITTAATDAGTWQFYCIPHSSVSGSTRTGMVGSIVVQAKPTPGFEVLAVVGAIAAAFVAVAVIHRRRP